jgi:predicted Na+-dependent transporter
MNLILVLLIPFPLGYLLTSRTTAVVAFVAAFSPLFTFQTLSLITDWAEGSTAAFGGPFPSSDYSNVVGYAAVNLVLYLVGFGLIMLGHRLGAKRRARRAAGRAVNLDPIH